MTLSAFREFRAVAEIIEKCTWPQVMTLPVVHY